MLPTCFHGLFFSSGFLAFTGEGIVNDVRPFSGRRDSIVRGLHKMWPAWQVGAWIGKKRAVCMRVVAFHREACDGDFCHLYITNGNASKGG